MRKLILVISILTLIGCEKSSDKAVESKNKSELNAYAENQKDSASKTIKIDPKMDIADLATCTAASMKIGQGIGVYKVWTEELTRRYGKIYSDKSASDLENYVGERITDKLKYLRSKGMDTQNSFLNFYDANCK